MMRNFAFASLAPAVVLIAASLFGGVWPALALTFITVMVFLLDKLTGDDWALPTDATGNGLSMLLGFTHFAVLGTVVWAVGGGVALTLLDQALILAGAGLWMGQVSNSNAHELIHRTAHVPCRLGVAIYSSLFFGHHASAHPKVHHINAATDKDPNSARPDEGFYSFAWRAWSGSYGAGLRAENMARARAAKILPAWRHPYLGYGLGTLASLLAAFALAGLGGVVVLCILALYATLQLLLSDYVQHYGLRRTILADGRPEPIGPHHAWNAPHWYSSAMMLNAPRHSDHHMHPARTFPALELSKTDMPMLPQSLPMMAVIALFPPIWKKMMNPRVAEWTNRPARRKTAQDIAPKTLAAARKGGLPNRNMPVWDYDKTQSGPSHSDAEHTGSSRTDERRGV